MSHYYQKNHSRNDSNDFSYDYIDDGGDDIPPQKTDSSHN